MSRIILVPTKVKIPTGWEVVESGRLLTGDKVYNTRTEAFDPITQNGNVFVEQCHLVIRKIPTAKKAATKSNFRRII